MMHTDIKSQEY